MIAVLIVDDLNSIREFLKINLSSEPDIQIVGLASNGSMAIAQAEKHQPDVILMDINMPGVIDGIQATKNIAQRFPKIKILLLTSQDNREQLDCSLKAGSRGYILKNTSIRDIASIIRLAEKGFFQIGPILGDWNGQQQDSIHSMQQGADLTKSPAASGEWSTIMHQNYSAESGDVSQMNHVLSSLSSELFQLQETIKSQKETIVNLTHQYSEVQQEIKTKLNKNLVFSHTSKLGNYGLRPSKPRSPRKQNFLFIISFLLGMMTVLILVLSISFFSG